MFLERKSDVYSYHVLDTYSVFQTYTAGCVKLIHLMKAKFRHDQNQAVLLTLLNWYMCLSRNPFEVAQRCLIIVDSSGA